MALFGGSEWILSLVDCVLTVVGCRCGSWLRLVWVLALIARSGLVCIGKSYEYVAARLTKLLAGWWLVKVSALGELGVLGCLDGSALSAVMDWVFCLGGYTPLIDEGICDLGGGVCGGG